MKIKFPEILDIPVTVDVETRNEGQRFNSIQIDDLLYLIDAIERKLGVDDSTDTTSIDYRVSTLEQLVTLQQATILLLQQALVIAKSYTASITSSGTVVSLPATQTGTYDIEIISNLDGDGADNGCQITNKTDNTFTATSYSATSTLIYSIRQRGS